MNSSTHLRRSKGFNAQAYGDPDGFRINSLSFLLQLEGEISSG